MSFRPHLLVKSCDTMPDNDDIDRRFEEMIRAEYGNVPGSGEYIEAASIPVKPVRPRTWFSRRKPLPDPIEYFNLSAEIDKAIPDEPERWIPPTPERIHPLPLRIKLAISLLVFAIAASLLLLAGVPIPMWARFGIVISFSGGLVILLRAIPHRYRNSGQDDFKL